MNNALGVIFTVLACVASAFAMGEELSPEEVIGAARFFTAPEEGRYAFGAILTRASRLDPRRSDILSTSQHLKMLWRFTPQRLRNEFELADEVPAEIAEAAALCLTAEAIQATILNESFSNLTPKAVDYLRNHAAELPLFVEALGNVYRIQNASRLSVGDQLLNELDELQLSFSESLAQSLATRLLGELQQSALTEMLGHSLHRDVNNIRRKFWEGAARALSRLPVSQRHGPLDFDFFVGFRNNRPPTGMTVRNRSEDVIHRAVVIVRTASSAGGLITGGTLEGWKTGQFMPIRFHNQVTPLKQGATRTESPFRVIVADASGSFLNVQLSIRPGVLLMTAPAGYFKKRKNAFDRLAGMKDQPTGRFALDPFPVSHTDRWILSRLRAILREHSTALRDSTKEIRTQLKDAQENAEYLSAEQQTRLQDCAVAFECGEIPLQLRNLAIITTTLSAGASLKDVQYVLDSSREYSIVDSRRRLKEFLTDTSKSVAGTYPDLAKRLDRFRKQVDASKPLEGIPTTNPTSGYSSQEPPPAVVFRDLAERYIQRAARRINDADLETLKKVYSSAGVERDTLEIQLRRFRLGDSFPDWCVEKESKYLKETVDRFESDLEELIGSSNTLDDVADKTRALFYYTLSQLYENDE